MVFCYSTPNKNIFQNQFKYHLFNKIFMIPPCKEQLMEKSHSVFSVGCEYINE